MTDAELSRLLVLDTAPGPALAISAADAHAIIDAALDGAGFGPGGDGGGEHSAAKGASSATAMAVTTKIAIVLGLALIAFVIAWLVARGLGSTQQGTAPPDVAIDAPIDVPATGAAMTIDAGVLQTDDELDELTIDPPVDDEPPRTKPTRPKHTAASDPDAADLLGEANAKRAAKQWRESDALYAKVVKRAPESLAAQTALIASASLHLEHLGDPKGAAQRFRRALAIAPAGALAEEARWGIAEAARANHDNAAEAAALDAFLAHHGRSPLAERARARRAELK